MNDIVGFIVGIEKYDQSGWDVPGPCRTAMVVAKWLLDIGASPGNILLFTNEREAEADTSGLAEQLAELERQGVRCGAPTYDNIDSRFNKLCDRREPGSRLFCFWSGHGYTNQKDDRILICTDYTTDYFAARVFNATDRLRRLHSTAYKCFSEQIFLADVCAKNVDLRFGADELKLGPWYAGTRQLGFFATRQGVYSHRAFSAVALAVLGATAAWPDLPEFLKRLLDRSEDANLEPFSIDAVDGQRKIQGRQGGSPQRDTEGEIVCEVHKLLSSIPLPLSRFRDHYSASVADLGIREKGRPNLLEMVSDLAELGHSDPRDSISYGLLQFLVRIGTEPELGQPVRDWVEAHEPKGRSQMRSEIDNVLALEQAERVLVLEVDNDETGEPTRLTWFICAKHDAVPSEKSQPQRVEDWQALAAAIWTILDKLAEQKIEISQIHFVVEPALFDRDFHCIQRSKDGPTLGQLFIVFLRYRARVYKPKQSPLRKAWEKRASQLREIDPAALKRIKIPPDGTNLTRLFDRGEGLCYAGFVFGSPAKALRNERRVISQLVEVMGIPYFYWLQRAPQEEEWAKTLNRRLGRWLRQCAGLRDFPTIVQENRAGGEEFAVHAALLWDDPQFVPFLPKISPAKR